MKPIRSTQTNSDKHTTKKQENKQTNMQSQNERQKVKFYPGFASPQLRQDLTIHKNKFKVRCELNQKPNFVTRPDLS